MLVPISGKDGLKMGCKNVKSFLSEPLVRMTWPVLSRPHFSVKKNSDDTLWPSPGPWGERCTNSHKMGYARCSRSRAVS